MESMEVEFFPGEHFYFSTEEDPVQQALDGPDKFLLIEPVETRVAFEVMADFVETVNAGYLQQRLRDALEGRKPFANFNHIIHNSAVREQWFEFKNQAYAELAKEWLEENATDNLKEKIKALPAVRIAE